MKTDFCIFIPFVFAFLVFFEMTTSSISAPSLQKIPFLCNYTRNSSNNHSKIGINISESNNSYCDDILFQDRFDSLEFSIDAKNQIIMDWSPKADCTAFKKMFLHHLGFLLLLALIQ